MLIYFPVGSRSRRSVELIQVWLWNMLLSFDVDSLLRALAIRMIVGFIFLVV